MTTTTSHQPYIPQSIKRTITRANHPFGAWCVTVWEDDEIAMQHHCESKGEARQIAERDEHYCGR